MVKGMLKSVDHFVSDSNATVQLYFFFKVLLAAVGIRFCFRHIFTLNNMIIVLITEFKDLLTYMCFRWYDN